ncbi:MAG: hypothetical protein WBN40_08310 [Pseudomonadales bacterium]
MLPLVAAVFLVSCIDSNDSNQAFIFPPQNALDFPSAAAVVASDSGSLTINGLSVASTSASIAQQLEISIQDDSENDPVVLAPLENTAGDAVFYWQAAPELQFGLNLVNVAASYSNGVVNKSMLVLRGSSWMWQAAMQADDSQGARRWLLLDTARRALITVDLASGEQTVFSGLDGTMLIGTGVELVEPVDFAIDAANARALVVDRGLRAIVAIDLASAARSIFSDAATPDAAAPLFEDPVAIELDIAAGTAYVLDRARTDLTQVALTDGARSDFDVVPALDEPELVNPVDMVLQPGLRLFVSDREANGVIEINLVPPVDTGDPVLGESKLLQSPGDDEDAVAAETVEAESTFYSRVGHLALLDDRLFVSDSGQFLTSDNSGFLLGISGAVIEVDISGDPEFDGDRKFLSANVPDFVNLFRSPQAIVLDDGDNSDTDDDRLLVLDNQLGAIVGVEIVETDPDVLDALAMDPDAVVAPVTLGRRTYLPGGASLDAAAIAAGERSRAETLSVNPAETIEQAIDTLDTGSGMLLLDRGQNTIFTIDYNGGARTRIDQAIATTEAGDDTALEAAQDAFEAARLQTPVAFAASSNGNSIYVVDQHDDTLVNVPLPFSGNSSVRALASAMGETGEANADHPFVATRALVAFEQILAEGASGAARDVVFVLEPGGIIEVDVSAIEVALGTVAVEESADLAANRSTFISAGDCAAWVAPNDMILLHERDEDGVTESAVLLLAEANTPTIHIVDAFTGACTRATYDNNVPGIDPAAMHIVDLRANARNSDAPVYELLLLDKGNGALFRLQVDVDTPPIDAQVEVLSSNELPEEGGNRMRSAIGLGLSERNKRAYVFDDVLRSLYLIDIAEREPTTGRRLTADEIVASAPNFSGQRLVIARGTSLNCQPVVDCDL